MKSEKSSNGKICSSGWETPAGWRHAAYVSWAVKARCHWLELRLKWEQSDEDRSQMWAARGIWPVKCWGINHWSRWAANQCWSFPATRGWVYWTIFKCYGWYVRLDEMHFRTVCTWNSLIKTTSYSTLLFSLPEKQSTPHLLFSPVQDGTNLILCWHSAGCQMNNVKFSAAWYGHKCHWCSWAAWFHPPQSGPSLVLYC